MKAAVVNSFDEPLGRSSSYTVAGARRSSVSVVRPPREWGSG